MSKNRVEFKCFLDSAAHALIRKELFCPSGEQGKATINITQRDTVKIVFHFNEIF